MSNRKIGSGHLSAFGRQGIRELRNLVNPSKEAPTVEEMGLYGTATQGEIAEARDYHEERSPQRDEPEQGHSRGRD